MNTLDTPFRGDISALCLLLRYNIRSGLYGPEGRLPDEAQLVTDLGVSRTALRGALALLAMEGVVERRRGQGTFVSKDLISHRSHGSRGLLNSLARQGLRGKHRVLAAQTWAMDPVTAANFGARPGTPMHVIERLTHIEGETANTSTYVVRGDLAPAMLRPELTEQSLDMLPWLEASLSTEIRTVDWYVEAVNAESTSARLLGCEEGAALIRTTRHFRGADGGLLCHGSVCWRGDRFMYQAVTEDRSQLPPGDP